MKNAHRTKGDQTKISLERRNGPMLEVMIDTVDLPKLDSHPGRWYASFRREGDAGSFFVLGYAHSRGRLRAFYLHRWLMDASDEEVVEIKNGDALDCRRANLEKTPRRTSHRKAAGPNVNNMSSGILGVTWDRHASKWKAQIVRDGIKTHLGLFDDRHEAGRVVAAARASQSVTPRQARTAGTTTVRRARRTPQVNLPTGGTRPRASRARVVPPEPVGAPS